MQLISQSETKKENLELTEEQSWKQKAWKTFFCALQILKNFFRK